MGWIDIVLVFIANGVPFSILYNYF
jgi:hypothetical protein